MATWTQRGKAFPSPKTLLALWLTLGYPQSCLDHGGSDILYFLVLRGEGKGGGVSVDREGSLAYPRGFEGEGIGALRVWEGGLQSTFRAQGPNCPLSRCGLPLNQQRDRSRLNVSQAPGRTLAIKAMRKTYTTRTSVPSISPCRALRHASCPYSPFSCLCCQFGSWRRSSRTSRPAELSHLAGQPRQTTPLHPQKSTYAEESYSQERFSGSSDDFRVINCTWNSQGCMWIMLEICVFWLRRALAVINDT